MIYLDNAATTMMYPEVLNAMKPYMGKQYGNAGTLYALGRESREAMDKARCQVASLLKCSPENIIFTSGGTESNNTVIFGLRRHLTEQGKTQIISSKVEHDSIIHALEALSRENEMLIKPVFDVRFLGVNNDCRVQIEELKKIISDKTGLVSVMFVNNETGARNPVEDIGKLCKQNGVLFHTDCVQAAGLQDIDVNKINCDFLSISAHKIHGPKGIGALYIRDKSIIDPIIHGGLSQEFGLRGGTENVPNIVGFGKACEIAQDNLKFNQVLIHNIASKFINAIYYYAEEVDLSENIRFNLIENQTKTLSLLIKDCDAQTLVLMLDNLGVCVSAGSACRSSLNEPSRVLTAMGLSGDEARSTIRISFSIHNTQAEAVDAAREIITCAKQLSML